MGAGNSSLAQLRVYQSAITKISQDISSKASNISNQEMNTNQNITIENLASPHVCADRSDLVQICFAETCSSLNDPPLYQCRLDSSGDPTTIDSCDTTFFSTLNEANDTDGLCAGTDTQGLSDTEKSFKCRNRAARLLCNPNPDVRKESTLACNIDSDCGSPNGTCVNNICFYTTNVGTFSSTCDDSCGIENIYVTRTGTPGAYTYYYGDELNPQTINPGHPLCISPNTSPCQYEILGSGLFNCAKAVEGGLVWQTGDDTYNENCVTRCDSLQCTQEELEISQTVGIIDCRPGNFCVSNVSHGTLSSVQVADASIDAQMTAAITNAFESEIDKDITQVNEDLNILQFNTSQERTSVTQSVKNTISNAINSASENTSNQFIGTTQNITIRNFGEIYGGHCAPYDPVTGNGDTNCAGGDSNEVGCGCNISNESVGAISSNNKAVNVIESVFNATVLNDLASKYKYKLSQKNSGIDIWGWIGAIVAILIIIAMGGFAVMYMGS